MKNIALIIFAAAATLAAIAAVAGAPVAVGEATRWTAIAALTAFAIQRRTLTPWIAVAMFLGAEVGHDFPGSAESLRVLSQIFLRLIKTVIGPLVFATLVVGIAGHANLKQVGRMGIKAIVYFELVTTVALFIGLAAINISKAGVGVKAPASKEQLTVVKRTASETILHAFPENIAKAVADGEVLQIVVFSIIFAVGLGMVRQEKRAPMVAFCESLSEVMFKFTNIVMLTAPIGVFGAIAYTVGTMGFGVLGNLLKLLATLYVALLVFLTCVLLPIAKFTGVPIRKFLAAIAEPVTIAFGTASSEAALPQAMENLEAMGVPREVVAFVMPTGYSFNLDGSSLYLSLASIFVAQAAGIHMTFGEQLVMCLTLMLTSKGLAGVARASLVILAATAASFKLPPEPILLIMGIDQLMDMARTSVNVIGNCLATVVVARWEGYRVDGPSAAIMEGKSADAGGAA